MKDGRLTGRCECVRWWMTLLLPCCPGKTHHFSLFHLHTWMCRCSGDERGSKSQGKDVQGRREKEERGREGDRTGERVKERGMEEGGRERDRERVIRKREIKRKI